MQALAIFYIKTLLCKILALYQFELRNHDSTCLCSLIVQKLYLPNIQRVVGMPELNNPVVITIPPEGLRPNSARVSTSEIQEVGIVDGLL